MVLEVVENVVFMLNKRVNMTIKAVHEAAMVGLVMVLALTNAHAQTSSLYHTENVERVTTAPPLPRDVAGQIRYLNPAIAAVSYTAVALPEPRQFAVNDLVAIIIQESVSNSSDQSLETSKETTIEGEISDFPRLSLSDLIQLQLRASGNANPPKVGLEFTKEFEGEGATSRKDTYSGRMQARIIDVKPNGTLVLEARKYLKSDKEMLEMILTGTCRAEDITAANTIQSSELYDLRLIKNHDGELRKATKKGLFTKLFEFLFNF